MTKYKAIRTESNGKIFDSKKQAFRYQELLLLQKSGEIKDLQCDVSYTLIPKCDKFRAIKYEADFQYKDKSGKLIVEDVKGMKGTPMQLRRLKASGAYRVFKIKQKLMYYVYGIEVMEVL